MNQDRYLTSVAVFLWDIFKNTLSKYLHGERYSRPTGMRPKYSLLGALDGRWNQC